MHIDKGFDRERAHVLLSLDRHPSTGEHLLGGIRWALRG
jgi:hypothetical protein